MNADDTRTAELIEASLEALADRVGDPAPLVYARLFARAPALEPLFALDADGSVRGEMLFRALENLFDLAAERGFAAELLAIETRNHLGYGVPAEHFPLFFEIIAEVCAEALGDDFTAAHAAAWRAVNRRAGGIVAGAAADQSCMP